MRLIADQNSEVIPVIYSCLTMNLTIMCHILDYMPRVEGKNRNKSDKPSQGAKSDSKR